MSTYSENLTCNFRILGRARFSQINFENQPVWDLQMAERIFLDRFS